MTPREDETLRSAADVPGDVALKRGRLLVSLWGRLKDHPLARIGPGLITGVADDDPSGIATYSQAGAQYRPRTCCGRCRSPIR